MPKKTTPGAGRGRRLLLLGLVALIAGFAGVLRFAYSVPTPGEALRLDAVYRLAAAGQVVSAKLLDESAQVVGTRCAEPVAAAPSPAAGALPTPPVASVVPAAPACPGATRQFHAAYPRSDVVTAQLIERVAATGGSVGVDPQTNRKVAKLVATFLFPLLILVDLFGLVFLSRAGDGGIAAIAGFGQLGRKTGKRQSEGVTFADVAGAEEAVAELREVTDYLRDPSRFKAFGAAAPKGVLLFGSPGCGKTLLARATAGETGVGFFSVSGTDFVESLVGVGAARVRDLFRQVREVAPAIVFIDEIDAVGRRRSGEGFSGGEREQTLNQLLVEMDGFDVTAGIVVMGASNRPDILDPALLRPGRFDRHVTLEPPDVQGRRAILELHSSDRPLAPDVDFTALARRTPGFTGADLANVVNEGALLAIRHDGEGRIGATHLNEAVLRVLHGSRSRGRLLSAEERQRIAVHESGHAVVAAAMGHGNDLHRVSTVARGRGLGQSLLTSDADRAMLTGRELEGQLAIAMGGVAAEAARFDDPSTMVGDDLEKATALAREMVGRYGMSPILGHMSLLAHTNGHLGGEDVALEPVSGATMQAFDEEVRRLLAEAEHRAQAGIADNAGPFDAMVEALVRDETLEGDALGRLVAAVRPMPVSGNGRARGPLARTRAPRT